MTTDEIYNALADLPETDAAEIIAEWLADTGYNLSLIAERADEIEAGRA